MPEPVPINAQSYHKSHIETYNEKGELQYDGTELTVWLKESENTFEKNRCSRYVLVCEGQEQKFFGHCMSSQGSVANFEVEQWL